MNRDTAKRAAEIVLALNRIEAKRAHFASPNWVPLDGLELSWVKAAAELLTAEIVEEDAASKRKARRK